MEYVFVGGEYQGTAGEGAGGECRCRCGFKSELIVSRDERDRLVDDGINVGIEALATHSQIITHLPYHHVGQKHHPLQETSARARFNPPKGPFSVSTTKPVPQRPAPTAKIHVDRASLYTRFMVSSSLTFPCTAHTYPFSVHSSSQSLLMYGTTICNERRWRDPCGVAVLGMTHIYTSTSDYLPSTRFFFIPLPKVQCYLKAASFNDRPSLNTTAGKGDIEYSSRF